MPLNRVNSRQIFTVTLLITAALALMPWGGRFTKDLADIINLPLTPFGDLNTSLTTWLRPGTSQPQAIEGSVRDRLEELTGERDRFEMLYRREQLAVQRLQQQLHEANALSTLYNEPTVMFVAADVTGHAPNVETDLYELNVGERDQVRIGAVAVEGAAHLIGRIIETSRFRSQLQPATARPSGPVQGIVYPSDQPDAPILELARVHLEPTGDGAFLADVDRSLNVEPGDVVRLNDPAWPAAAQSLIIGTIIEVRDKDQQPLRQRIVVEPRYSATDLADVMLVMTDESDNVLSMEDSR